MKRARKQEAIPQKMKRVHNAVLNRFIFCGIRPEFGPFNSRSKLDSMGEISARRAIIASMFLRRALFFLSILGFSGCNSKPKSAENSAPVAPNRAVKSFASPRDDLGREIALNSPAKRAIVIGPGAIETIYALGAEKSLIGRDDYADFPPAAKKIAVAGDYQGPSVEKSVALRPDLVIVQGETWDIERVENWQKKIGAPVAALKATNIKEVARDIDKIGLWLGREKQAETLALALRRQAFVAPPKRRPTAFLEVSRAPLWTAGNGTLLSDVARRAGFQNIAADVRGYKAYSLESLAARAPDVYIMTMAKPNAKVAIAELKKVPALGNLRAVQKGNVVVIDADFLLRPGPRLGEGIRQLRVYRLKMK